MKCEELFEFEIIDDVCCLKRYMRRDDPSLTDIEIPDEHTGKKLGRIMPCAFAGARYIRTVHIPESVTELESYTFWNCASLVSIVIPPKTRRIRNGCFKDCTSLEEVDITEGLEKISYRAFAECVSLKKITLPETLKEISNSAFENCLSLEEITLHSRNIKISGGGGAFSCPKLPAETLAIFAKNRYRKDQKTSVNWRLALSRADVFALALKDTDDLPPPGRVVGIGDVSLLAAAAESGKFTAEYIDELVGYSSENGSTEVTAWLLDYKNRTFGFDGGDNFAM